MIPGGLQAASLTRMMAAYRAGRAKTGTAIHVLSRPLKAYLTILNKPND